VFFQNVLSLPLIAMFAPWFGAWPRLPAAQLPWFLAHAAGSAALAFVSLLLLSWAYARAQAHRLLPLEYSAFGWAALMGWLWFGETVGPGTLLGVGLIVGGCWFGTRGAHAEPGEQSAL
jgi:S-adenosylmethionine uptake transporter